MRAVWMSVIAKELHTHTKLAETGSVVVASLSRISDEARQRGVQRAEMRKMEGAHLAKSFSSSLCICPITGYQKLIDFCDLRFRFLVTFNTFTPVIEETSYKCFLFLQAAYKLERAGYVL